MKIAEKIKYYNGFDLDPDKYSIHTFEMSTRLTKWQYNYLLDILASCEHTKKIKRHENLSWDEGDPFVESTMYSIRKDTGISRFRVYSIAALNRYYLTLSCNVRVLLQIKELPFVCIVEPDDIKRIYDRLQEVFDTMGISQAVSVQELYFRRIDYCTNIRMESVEAADIYMGLLAKGRALYSSERRVTMYAGEEDRIKHPKSLKWKGSSFEIEIYEKYDMLEDQQVKYGYDAEEVAEASKRIRFEVRIDGRAISQKKQRNGCLTNEEFMNMSCWQSAELISKNLVRMYGCGNFVSYKTAVEIIHNSRMYQKTKDILLAFITELAKPEATVDSAYEVYINKPNGRRVLELHEIMKLFNELRISPITIPDNVVGYQRFNNPVYYIDQRNANYN